MDTSLPIFRAPIGRPFRLVAIGAVTGRVANLSRGRDSEPHRTSTPAEQTLAAGSIQFEHWRLCSESWETQSLRADISPGRPMTRHVSLQSPSFLPWSNEAHVLPSRASGLPKCRVTAKSEANALLSFVLMRKSCYCATTAFWSSKVQ